MSKILFLHPVYWEQTMGGAELQIKYAMKHAKENGYEVFCIFENNGKPLTNNDIHLLPVKKPFLRRYFGNIFIFHFFKIMRLLNKIKPDIIYTRYDCAWSGFAAFYAKKHKIKHIWAIASDREVASQKKIFQKNILYFIEKRWINYAIRNSTKIVCQNVFQQDTLLKIHNRRSLLIQQMSPLVDEKYIVKSIDEIKILWIANFRRIKRPDIFIKMVQSIRTEKKCNFIMIGRNEGEWQNLKNTNTDARLSILGELRNEDVNELLLSSHILVNTSEYEGFSNTFVQAWMRKVPVVSMNSNPNNVITNYNIGFICPTIEQLVDKVTLLINNDELRISLGETAYNYAKQNHNLDVNMQNLFSYINE